MRKNFIGFLSSAMVITGVLLVAESILKSFWADYNLRLGFPVILLFLFLYTFIHWYLLKIAEKEPKKFVNAFMGFTGLKMLALLTFLGVFIYTRPEEKISFMAVFLAAYVLHTVNEIFWAGRFVKSADR